VFVSLIPITERRGESWPNSCPDSPAELLAEKVCALVRRWLDATLSTFTGCFSAASNLTQSYFSARCDRAGADVDPIKSLEKAILKLEKHDPAHTKTEIANLFPAAQRKLDFGVISEDVLHAIRSWHRVLATVTR